VCDEAGLKGLSAHGLRHATGRSLAEAGCTEKQIAAILGHNLADQLRLVSTYVDRTLRGPNPPTFRSSSPPRSSW
jgi:integrase